MAETILVVDDQASVRQLLQEYLKEQGYRVIAAADGQAALYTARNDQPDLILLDIMMPKMDGYQFLRAYRKERNTPVIILTAREEETDAVLGLDLGADDYVIKPFRMRELLARIRALLRRTQPERIQVLKFADLTLDTGSRQAIRAGKLVQLTAKEYELLELFMRHPRQVLKRDTIFERVWEYDFGGESNVLEVYIRYLRQKLEFDDLPRLIHTVRGVGYVMREEP